MTSFSTGDVVLMQDVIQDADVEHILFGIKRTTFGRMRTPDVKKALQLAWNAGSMAQSDLARRCSVARAGNSNLTLPIPIPFSTAITHAVTERNRRDEQGPEAL